MFRPKRRSDDFRFPHFLGAAYLPTSLATSRITVVVAVIVWNVSPEARQTDMHFTPYLSATFGRVGGRRGERA